MTEILTLIIRFAVAVMVGFVIPALRQWIKSKAENEKVKQLVQVADTAVYAAEQLYHGADPDGEIRRRYAHKLISAAAMRLGLALTEKEIDSLIQAAVQEINLVNTAGIKAHENMDT